MGFNHIAPKGQDIKTFLMEYLENMDNMYAEYEGRMFGWTDEKGLFLCTRYFKWIIEHGQFYERDIEATNRLIENTYYTPKIKECYHNSMMLLTDNLPSELGYCEGFMISSSFPMPIEHAWNVLDGKVLDFTSTLWRENNQKEERIYFGVEMPKMWAIHHMLDVGITGPYLKDFVYEQIKGMN